ncbi:something about silencing protein 10-like isoform X2 [Acanthaster planci]|nr:something about silencing protein 10-like isoform X2 [Acanthaster planci]XP_022089515.1 something about silencing protein 10-like isoform X2 [Acanthaster planci]XP_022089516.1 something about silencing protein 10-like isoform X2 [Acanthaster planci]
MPVPDPTAPDYFMDEVDEFNENRDKILLERDGRLDGESDSENQEEILPLDYSDSDDDDIDEKLRRIRTQQHLDEIASDLEDEEEGREEPGEETGLPDAKSWGKGKKEYYHTDYVDDDMPGASGSEDEEAFEEEKEALAIQKRMSQMMQETDFDMQLFQVSVKAKEKKATDLGEEAEEKVVKDLSKLSKREKMEILKKESPEFLELVGDFKTKLKEVINTLHPLLGMVKDGRIPQGPGADYISTKYRLYINYCVNISFYMTLKAKHVPVHNHPVITRILAHKKLIKELEPLDQQLELEIQELLEKQQTDDVIAPDSSDENASSDKDGIDSDDDATLTRTTRIKAGVKAKKGRHEASSSNGRGAKAAEKTTQDPAANRSPGTGMTPDEEQRALEYYEKIAKEVQERRLERKRQAKDMESQEEAGDEEGEEAEDGKRAITYEISKNKGLTPRRKKEQRNPRVKHRMKFKKAKVRRKGQVREVRKELTRYGGEISGIRAGVIKSIQIK